ncbi:MAG TPA: 5-methyltetrahydropteroyltriglutamate--homocysteine S-methyltransferase, partial [Stenotrophomonas sp.]|nr:5-methyltetrahydropteroyltriglutamate--homocysteine S-methyltransferase [Stenotrophomonas sp.]
MTIVTNLGFPRIGAKRELKRSLEAYWSGQSSAEALQDTATALRTTHWQLQRDAGVDVPPSNDFSLYDQVLDAAFLFDAIPARYRALADADPLAGYFAMARGLQRDGFDLHALEMTKWFDTNYHYLVPELQAGQGFALRGDKPLAEYRQAKALGIETRPVLIGPVTFLLLSKTTDGSPALDLLDALLPVYVQLLDQLQAAGAQWVQLDEPALVQDLSPEARAAFEHAYAVLATAARPKVLVATYFGALDDNLELAASLPVEGLHVDLVRAPEQLDAVIKALPPGRVLSAGLVNGRNIWRTHLDNALVLARYAHGQLGSDFLWLAPSCSLLHSPVDLAHEKKLDDELRGWLAFSKQKLEELRVLADAIDAPARAEAALELSRERIASRKRSPRVHNPAV